MDINEFIMSNESVIRLSFFLGIFAIMAIWEFIAPRRALTVSKVVRWTNNLGLVFLNSFILRLLFPAAAVGIGIRGEFTALAGFAYRFGKNLDPKTIIAKVLKGK